MSASPLKLVLTAGAVLAAGYSACSPDTGSDSGSGAGNGSGQAVAGADASLGNGSGTGSGSGNSGFGNGGSNVMFGSGDGGLVSSATDASCRAVSQEPEQVVVYRDATVTDTIVTYDPIALYIMMDRSSSMVGVLGDPNSWPNALGAIDAFVHDPASEGLDVGMAVFPPVGAAFGGVDCANGTDCGQPVVPIGRLPGHGQALLDGMNNNAPGGLGFTPMECALRGMINHCAQHMSNTGEQCVAILVTDGAPTDCNGDPVVLEGIVADGLGQGVLTFALGLPGSNLALLDQLAQAGGTDCTPNGPGFACDLQSGGQQAFIDALNSIRDKVVTTETMQVTKQEVVSTPLDCQWTIPEPPAGREFDPEKVNLQFTPSGQPPRKFGYVPSEGDCGSASDAWYFDDADNPTEVLVCPNACDVVKNSPGARIDIQLGCARIDKIPE